MDQSQTPPCESREGHPEVKGNSSLAIPLSSFWLGVAGIIVLAVFAYANHFTNSFQFDDGHTIVNNPWIRELRNIPRFFHDATTFSTFFPNRSYRPVVTTSLAVDYWLGHGLDPLWFHVSSFFWFLVQILMMAVLFRQALGRTFSVTEKQWTALLATAVYAVHPAMAETLNYVIQRGDLYSTLGVVAGLVIYSGNQGRRGLYLLPVVLGLLSKPPALVFPILLLLWMIWIEDIPTGTALRRSIPAFAVTSSVMFLTWWMTPKVHGVHAIAAGPYIGTQPAVLLHYLGEFFLPLWLSGDSDRLPFESATEPLAIAGLAFVVLLMWCISWCSRRRELRVIAFGLSWFLIASLPTSLFALAEVENDHRMFFPFVGLTLAVSAAVARAVVPSFGRPRMGVPVCAAVAGLALAGLAWGTTQRNKVWNTEESFWYDVTQKSPRNGRGLSAYGLTLIKKGDYARALTVLEQATNLLPQYYPLELNLALVWGYLGNPEVAESHYRRSIELAPGMTEPRNGYAMWLIEQGRETEALAHVAIVLRQNPDNLDARYLQMGAYDKLADNEGLRAAAAGTLSIFPSDRVAQELYGRASLETKNKSNHEAGPTPEELVNQSMRFAVQGQWAECIGAARQAISMKPSYAMAWNNLATCQNGQKNFTEAIRSAHEALRLQPDLELAKKNLTFSEAKGLVPGVRAQ